MINKLKAFLGWSSQVDLKMLVKNGALIVDVRNKSEYATGHIKGSVNIPLDTLSNNLNLIEGKSNSIITCCATGMRSSVAKGILKSNGFTEVYNGGGWQSLLGKIS